jgi:hypothetical protein
MHSLLAALALLLGASRADALSVACPDPSFPRRVDGAIEIVADAGDGRASYTVLLPDRYEGEALDGAELQVHGAAYALIRVPLATQRTEVAEWQGKLVATVHTANNTQPMRVEATYGFPCRWVLTATMPRTAKPTRH